MKSLQLIPVFIVVLIAAVLLGNSLYTVNETEQVILTQFGKPVGGPVTDAGLKLRAPFIQKVNRIEARILEWDGTPTDMPTKDKLYISVDTFARWRITDPLLFFQRLRDEQGAHSRLDDGVAFGFQSLPQAPAHQRLVFDNQNSRGHRPGSIPARRRFNRVSSKPGTITESAPPQSV